MPQLNTPACTAASKTLPFNSLALIQFSIVSIELYWENRELYYMLIHLTTIPLRARTQGRNKHI